MAKKSRLGAALRHIFDWLIKRSIKKDPDLPDDPYAYVTAPKKPRPSIAVLLP
ncbi:MAG TPA: hypothetical protein VFB79_12560 [Candidatus Angelobacter sp.]|nr:hypothetical protein [Candidatus Angelobacter sp.]